MERGDPIERRGAVIPDAPLLGQLGHRVQLVLDHAQVAVIDRVSDTDASRRQAPRPNPPADSLGVPTQPIGSLSDSQHAEDGTPSPGPQTLSPSNIGDQQRPTTTNHVHVHASANSVARCQAGRHVPASRHSHEAGRRTRDVGSQGSLDRRPRHWHPQRRLNRSMDVLGSHRLAPIGQHPDDCLQHPAWPARSLPAGHRPPPKCVARPHGGEFLGQAGQRPL
jgi:hypothetical protein